LGRMTRPLHTARDFASWWGAIAPPAMDALSAPLPPGIGSNRGLALGLAAIVAVVFVLGLAVGRPLAEGVRSIHRRVAIARHLGSSLRISGAPGYRTFTGPRGEPMAVGRPWGPVCQPVRFT